MSNRPTDLGAGSGPLWKSRRVEEEDIRLGVNRGSRRTGSSTHVELEKTRRPEDVERMHRFAGFGIGLASLFTEDILSHPCIVLRRQCQVNYAATKYHLNPFSVVQIMISLQRHQGYGTLWKGIGSKFMVQGILLGSETVISELSNFPRELTRYSTVKMVTQHIALKGLSIVIALPFISASLIETIQSDIASERPGMFDCLKEGFCRVFALGVPQSSRLLPLWALVLPTVLHGLLHYVVSSVVQQITLVVLRRQRRQLSDAERERSVFMETFFPELISAFTANVITDIALYPLETVNHRLIVQGTRTIIDNTDNGSNVLPVNSNYRGVKDCFRALRKDEGILGFYKGFGTLIVQYSLQASILRVAHFFYVQISGMFH